MNTQEENLIIRRQENFYKPGEGFLRKLFYPHYGLAQLDASYKHVVLDPLIKNIQQDSKEMRALDVGAGKGEVAKYLRMNGISTIPLDINPIVLNDAEGVQAPAWHPPESFSGGFNVVHMKDALVHIPTALRGKFFIEMNRVLKEEGLLLICSASSYSVADLQYPVSRKKTIALAEQCGFVLEQKMAWKPLVSAKDWYPRGLRKRFVLVLKKDKEISKEEALPLEVGGAGKKNSPVQKRKDTNHG